MVRHLRSRRIIWRALQDFASDTIITTPEKSRMGKKRRRKITDAHNGLAWEKWNKKKKHVAAAAASCLFLLGIWSSFVVGFVFLQSDGSLLSSFVIGRYDWARYRRVTIFVENNVGEITSFCEKKKKFKV